MADNWFDNASNQLFTLKALRNACNLGVFGYSTLPADTREICTVVDLNTYGITYLGIQGGASTSAYNTFSGFSDQLCLDVDSMNIVAYTKGTLQANLCADNTGTYEIIYFSDASLANGTQIYTNRARTTTKTYAASGYLYIGGVSYTVSTAGVITANYPC
jgi:hypothetical protein